MADKQHHMLVAKFEEISAGMILMLKSGQLFRHEFTEEFPFLKVFGPHHCRLLIPGAQPRSCILPSA